MWNQVYDPFNNSVLSTVFAALPVVTLLVLIASNKVKAHFAAITYGASFYRNLFWEAGLVGQVLYLEAEEAGIRSAGIGCDFDDPVHGGVGISSLDLQSFYQFKVGGPLEGRSPTSLAAGKLGGSRL